MTNHSTQTLEDLLTKIISMSRHLLSRLSESFENETLDASQLSDLMVSREKLIHLLFEQFPMDEIQVYIDLVNEVLELDTTLSQKCQEYKNALTTQLLSFQNNKKAVKTYQKY